MPRKPREKSISGIYHCILRGINKQDIFFENQDYFKFLKILEKTKKLYQFKLYSYVLMPNHIHLEIKDENGKLSKIMQSMEISYASYFNQKYNRVGHLFENKFRSKAIETEDYMLNLQRYIHQNPQKARISTTEEYRWSSYKEYIYKANLVDKEEVLSMFSEDRDRAINNFVEYNKQVVRNSKSQELLEYEIKKQLTDNELISLIKEELNIDNIQEIQKYSKKDRDELLMTIKKVIVGWNYKQLSRVLGISIRVIQRTIRNKKNG